jgi:hypothetical protein
MNIHDFHVPVCKYSLIFICPSMQIFMIFICAFVQIFIDFQLSHYADIHDFSSVPLWHRPKTLFIVTVQAHKLETNIDIHFPVSGWLSGSL